MLCFIHPSCFFESHLIHSTFPSTSLGPPYMTWTLKYTIEYEMCCIFKLLIQSSVYTSYVWYLGQKGPTRLYHGLGSVRAAICLMSNRGIQCPRCWTPRICAGKFCPMNSEVHDEWTLPKFTCASEDTNRKRYMDLPRVCLTHMYLVYLGLIRSIHKSDLSIPRIELACHSSSEVSTVDLY